jgi:hypothetical protein
MHTTVTLTAFLQLSAAIVLLLAPRIAYLQGVGPQLIPESGTIGDCSFITGDFSYDCFPLYLAYLIRLAFTFAGGFALFEIIKGGYEYALSGIPGNLTERETAKKRIVNALIGMTVVILAFLIVDTLVSAVFLGPS